MRTIWKWFQCPTGDGLTWFLCGGVDGCRLWPGASRIESSHREVVHCVRFQPRDVNQRVVSRYAHFANSVRLGVVFPVHDLLGKKTNKKLNNHGHKQPDSSGAFHCIIEIHIPSWNLKCCLYYRRGGRARWWIINFSLVESQLLMHILSTTLAIWTGH